MQEGKFSYLLPGMGIPILHSFGECPAHLELHETERLWIRTAGSRGMRLISSLRGDIGECGLPFAVSSHLTPSGMEKPLTT